MRTDLVIAAIAGLLIGSFLNVVIHRLPRMLERAWARSSESATAAADDEAPYNLLRPRSHCPRCAHAIQWHENIPVLSWLLLRGRCAHCSARISLRYPLVELATAALFTFCVWTWGPTATALAWCGFAAALLALALIDAATSLLPDEITQPLLWAGLIAAALGVNGTPLPAALWGAVAGYLSLWLVYWAFKLATGKEGMGYGDFKLYAALGAWFGWQPLIGLILLASLLGIAVGVALKLAGKLEAGARMPFGPFLAAAGFAALLFGPQPFIPNFGI